MPCGAAHAVSHGWHRAERLPSGRDDAARLNLSGTVHTVPDSWRSVRRLRLDCTACRSSQVGATADQRGRHHTQARDSTVR